MGARIPFPTRSWFVLSSVLVSCASAKPASGDRAAGAPDRASAERIVSAPDRTERDRAMDAHRKPVEMLVFFGAAPGMRVGEIGAGGGYSTELFARAVGLQGRVSAHDSTTWDGPALQKAWQARLARPSMQNTTHFVRPWDDPLPPEAHDLDAVYSVAIYHDVLAEKGDPAKMNAAVFRALKPGGVYAIIDNSAKAGAGSADAEPFHRVDERSVRDQVEQAGFRFAGEGSFLRNPDDTRDWNADPTGGGVPGKVHTQDRFALKFVKP